MKFFRILAIFFYFVLMQTAGEGSQVAVVVDSVVGIRTVIRAFDSIGGFPPAIPKKIEIKSF
ncbi:MAG: hypothetical protein K2J46_09685 [Muribaculaceae bacterium]|nr:hypothetical protein [Muribaculaceae bacterium]